MCDSSSSKQAKKKKNEEFFIKIFLLDSIFLFSRHNFAHNIFNGEKKEKLFDAEAMVKMERKKTKNPQ